MLKAFVVVSVGSKLSQLIKPFVVVGVLFIIIIIFFFVLLNGL